MKKTHLPLLFILAFLLIPAFAFSQNSDKTTKPTQNETDKKHGPAFAISFQPEYYSQTASSVYTTTVGSVVHRVAYAGGLTVEAQLNEKTFFETGLMLSTLGYQTPKLSYYRTPVNPTDTAYTSYSYNLTFLDIPFKINYFFLERNKIKLFISAGCHIGINISETGTLATYYNNGTTGIVPFDNNVGQIDLLGHLGFGLTYDMSQKLFLKIEPTFTWLFTDGLNTLGGGLLYSAGLDVGIYIH